MNVLKGSKHCWNGDGTTINLFFHEFEVDWVGKSLLESDLKSQNSLYTTDDKYSRRNMQNFPQQLETPLSQKQKTFCGFFIAFLKWAWNLERLEKKRWVS